jgi:molybdopterin converting factor small subunit
MARVRVELPSLLASLVEGRRRLTIEAVTLAEAIGRLRSDPALGRHLCDERGAVRPHVLVFLNDTSTRCLESLELLLRDDDVITITQAVSGG